MQDLEEALLLDPEGSDVMQQCTRAKRDLSEHKRMRELQDGQQGDTPQQCADKVKACQDMERHVRDFASCQLANNAASPDTKGKENSSKNPAGLGFLPQRQPKTKRSTASLANALRQQVQESNDMRMYFRACGGLSAAVQQLHCSLRANGTAESVSACAKLLSEACQLESNTRALAGCSAATASNGAAGPSTAAVPRDRLSVWCAASLQHVELAVLLQVLSTEAEARKALADALRHPSSAKLQTLPLQDLVTGLPALADVHFAVQASFLANCSTEPGIQNAHAVTDANTCAAALVQSLQQAKSAATLERVALLIGNMASNITMRRALASSDSVSALLVERCLEMRQVGNADAASALQACLMCLYNMSLDDAVKSQLVSQPWADVLARLLPPDGRMKNGSVTALSVVARSASARGAYQMLEAASLVPRVLAAAQHAYAHLPEDGGNATAVKVLDATVRAWAAWGSAGFTEALRSEAALQLLVWACSAGSMSDTSAGNAALCISFIADQRCVPLEPC